MKYGIAGLILVLVLTWGISEILLPDYYEKLIESSLRKQVDEVDLININISTRPAFLLLTGRVDYGSLQTHGVIVNGLRLEELVARYENLILKKTSNGMQTISGSNTFLKAMILEDDMEHYLKTQVPTIEKLGADMEVYFNSDEVVLDFALPFFGSSIDLQLSGFFEIIDNRIIRYQPKNIEAGKIGSSKIIAQMLQELEFDLNLGQFLLPLELQKINLENGKLIILGGSRQ